MTTTQRRRVIRWAERAREAARHQAALNHKRDQAIKNWSDEGASLREIAQAADMSHTAVAYIVKRESDEGEDQ